MIELLVVIAVIAILSTIGLISLNGARESARDATRKADISHLRTALALYFDEYEQYPIPAGPVGNPGDGPDVSTTTLDGTIFSQNNNPISPRYLSRTIVDPINNFGADLYYYYDTNQTINHRGYVLCFRKEGGQLPRYFYYNTGVYGGGSDCPTLP